MKKEMPDEGTYEAWVHGAHFPEELGQPGYSVSAWAIRSPDSGSWDFHTKVSRQPTNYHWIAAVHALRGPAEMLPPGAALRIYSLNKELVRMFNCRFRRADGSRAAGGDVADALFALIDQNRLSVEVVHRTKDKVAQALALRAKATSQERKQNRERDAA